ncbi:MAG: cyclase family protein [Pseudomonadota bacterium]
MIFKRSGIACAALAVGVSLTSVAWAQDAWYPSKFGKDDEAGRSNLMTSARVLEAMTYMKKGTVVPLARTYESAMPLFGARAFAVRGTSGLAGGPVGENKVIWMDDFLATEIGQVGTQFDGLGHIGIGGDKNRFYNGLESAAVTGSYGLKKLGIEKVKPFFTKGILIDMVSFKGKPMDKGEEITVADIEGALQKQGLSADSIGEGHVVLIHTGWSRHWIKDNATFNSGCPGIGVAAAKWLADKGVVIVGADTWPVEVVPNPNPKLAFPVHQIFITRNGIFIHENVATERLADAKVYEFAYIFAPLPVKGATGSPGNAIAVY